MKRSTLTLAALALLLAGPAQVMAGLILDQSYVPSPSANAANGLSSPEQIAQTFTVGITGNLAEIDVLVQQGGVGETGHLFFDITGTSSGVPITDNSQVFASGEVDVPFQGQEFVALTGFSVPVSSAALSATFLIEL